MKDFILRTLAEMKNGYSLCGVIDRKGRVYPLGSDTKVISSLFEIVTRQVLMWPGFVVLPENSGISAHATEAAKEQIVKQLHKLVNVIEVSDLAGEKHVQREMLLAKVAHDNSEQSIQDIHKLAQQHDAEVIECLDAYCMIQMMAVDAKIDRFIKVIQANRNVLEIVRSGTITLSRSEQILGDKK